MERRKNGRVVKVVFVTISLVADTLGSDHYQEKQIAKFLEKNVKKVTRNLGWELLFAAGETNQNKGFYIGFIFP